MKPKPTAVYRVLIHQAYLMIKDLRWALSLEAPCPASSGRVGSNLLNAIDRRAWAAASISLVCRATDPPGAGLVQMGAPRRKSVLRVILANVEVELVPESVAGHPAVRNQAKMLGKQPTRLLLDSNAHRAALQQLDGGERRGRPDILQYCLLTLLESPLNKQGGLEVGIHTRDGHWIRVKPETRLPRGEARFQGVFARVLAEGQSQDKDPLVWSQGILTPEQVLAKFGTGTVLRLDPAGPPVTFEDLPGRSEDDLTLVVGGFAHGEFTDDWQAATPECISLWPELLTAWAVLGECVAHWRAQKAPTPSGSTAPA